MREPEKHNSKAKYDSLESATTPQRGEFRDLFERERLIRDGWAMRVFTHHGPHKPADYRTVGLSENFKHPNLQLYFPVSEEIALATFFTIVDLIKAGAKFKDGDVSRDVAEEMPVKFIKVTIGNAEFLRVIIPDKQGKVDEGKISAPFSLQYRDTTIASREQN